MAPTANRDLVIARDFGPKARRLLVLLATLLLALGLMGYHVGQGLTVVVLPQELDQGGPRVLADERGFEPREVGLVVLLGLFAGGLAGAGLGVLLYAFAHPMVRHRATPYLALVLLGQLLAAVSMPLVVGSEREATGVVRVSTGPLDEVPQTLGEFVVGLIPPVLVMGAFVFIAWILLRPEDFEGTLLYRRYLARDLPPSDAPALAPAAPTEEASS